MPLILTEPFRDVIKPGNQVSDGSFAPQDGPTSATSSPGSATKAMSLNTVFSGVYRQMTAFGVADRYESALMLRVVRSSSDGAPTVCTAFSVHGSGRRQAGQCGAPADGQCEVEVMRQ